MKFIIIILVMLFVSGTLVYSSGGSEQVAQSTNAPAAVEEPLSS